MQRNIRNPRRAPRQRGRTDRRQLHNDVVQDVVSMMSPRAHTTAVLPRPNTSAIEVTKRFQIDKAGAGISPVLVSVSDLMQGVPGGLTYWNSVRLEKFDIYASEQVGETVTQPIHKFVCTVAAESSWSQPPTQFESTLVPGANRASVGFKLGLLARSRWFGTSDTTTICELSDYDGTAGTVKDFTIFFTCSLRSNVITE